MSKYDNPEYVKSLCRACQDMVEEAKNGGSMIRKCVNPECPRSNSFKKNAKDNRLNEHLKNFNL